MLYHQREIERMTAWQIGWTNVLLVSYRLDELVQSSLFAFSSSGGLFTDSLRSRMSNELYGTIPVINGATFDISE